MTDWTLICIFLVKVNIIITGRLYFGVFITIIEKVVLFLICLHASFPESPTGHSSCDCDRPMTSTNHNRPLDVCSCVWTRPATWADRRWSGRRAALAVEATGKRASQGQARGSGRQQQQRRAGWRVAGRAEAKKTPDDRR